MKKILFKDVLIGQEFLFSGNEYVRVGFSIAMNFSGNKFFNQLEIVTI